MSARTVRHMEAGGPVTGRVALPGSKSDTNRALVIAALARGTSTLSGASGSDDTQVLVRALEQLGVSIARTGDEIEVSGGSLTGCQGTIDLGPAGTSYRFVLPLCAMAPGSDIVLTGSRRMQERPIGDLVEALRKLGASIEFLETEGCPPLRVRGVERLAGGSVSIPGEVSSQFVSALLMAAPRMARPLTVDVTGTFRSRSYVDMTRETMARFGVPVTVEGQTLAVASGAEYRPTEYRVDGDASGASYLWALAAATGGCVRVENLDVASNQGDLEFATILERMGCQVRRSAAERWIEVEGNGSLRGVRVDMSSMPDTSLTLAVLASRAEGETHIDGLHSLPHKETDRLEALRVELSRCGVQCETTEHSIRIHGGTPHGATIETYDDHRMAMAFAVLGTSVPGIAIRDPGVVSKSFPDYWERLESIGVRSHVR